MQETDILGKKTAASNRPALNCLQYLQPGADGRTNCTYSGKWQKINQKIPDQDQAQDYAEVRN